MAQSALWIFGYGSLLWNPGFHVKSQTTATLRGYERSFCMKSIHHRGTEEVPGLVLALSQAEGANCTGIGFEVAPDAHAETMAALRERELVSAAYLEVTVPITLADGQTVDAVTYVIDAAHDQYMRDLTLEDQAVIMARAIGGRGPNDEYLHNTVGHLQKMGITDPDLEWLSARVRALSPQRS
jgi:cation transport protein ChaC